MADHNHETSVLLSSFELEQVLDEMPAGERRPKVKSSTHRAPTSTWLITVTIRGWF